MLIRPVILSGGAGTRMWPVSRARFPKQFADLYGEMCLFERTLTLVSDRALFAPPLIVANKDHKFLILDLLARKGIADAVIVLEPVGRNTAASALVAALIDRDRADKIQHLVLPSDHVITQPDAFRKLVVMAQKNDAGFTLFGIQPSGPDTGFGYILPGDAEAGGLRKIRQFTEKPDLKPAEALIAEGALWNSGIFFYNSSTLIEEADRLAPDTVAACDEALRLAKQDLGCVMLDEATFSRLESHPFDKLIMERTKDGHVIACDVGWSDVGTWKSLWAIEDKDAQGNAVRGPASVEESARCYVRSYGPTLSVLGIKDLAVIATKDAVLVMPLDRSQDVRKIVEGLVEHRHDLALQHPCVMRPWGSYESVASGPRFQVKQIKVLPGKSLSLQKHFHRAEHWVVVAGTASIECDGEVKDIYPNQSVFIPQGSVHRLSNKGHVDLDLIEVQSGDYLGEDDIVRLSDNYGRV